MRWNTRDAWIVSPAVTHEAVIDEDTFRKAQTAIEEQGAGTRTRVLLARGVAPVGRIYSVGSSPAAAAIGTWRGAGTTSAPTTAAS